MHVHAEFLTCGLQLDKGNWYSLQFITIILSNNVYLRTQGNNMFNFGTNLVIGRNPTSNETRVNKLLNVHNKIEFYINKEELRGLCHVK